MRLVHEIVLSVPLRGYLRCIFTTWHCIREPLTDIGFKMSMTEKKPPSKSPLGSELRYVQYHSSKEADYLSAIRQLISTDLSEPYSIYVYRYFLYEWGDLCFMVSNFTWFDALFIDDQSGLRQS
jgi:hypothetical protein